MWVKASAFVVLLFLIATAPLLANEAPAKQAWQWTLEERIAARTDAKAARERVRAAARNQVGTNAATPEWRVDDIDGKVHPELFLPHEVFRTLVRGSSNVDARARDSFRKGLQRKVDQHRLPPDFWVKLEAIATVYAADMQAALDMGQASLAVQGEARKRATEALELKNDDVCRSRAAALEAAYKEFGTERLNRFLYTVIAPHMFSVTETLPSAELLRKAAGGCR